MTLYGRRRANNALYLALSWTATGIGLAILFLILWTLLSNGIPALGTDLFVENTPPPGGRGGIANAIFGSLVMTGIATLVGTPVGVLTGTYLAELRAASRIASATHRLWSINMNGRMANLPVVIFQFALSPYADWQELAWGGAMLITITILLLNILARILASWSDRSP